MPSFDISAKADAQTLDNVINIVKKEIATRYDFKGAHIVVELDKKNFMVNLEFENDMQLRQLEDMLITKAMRNGLEASTFNFDKEYHTSGKVLKKQVTVINGLSKDDAKKVVKLIKDSGLKVQPAIMDDIVRVTGKKIDDLQEVIQLCRKSGLNLPLQFVNMKN
ncbi:MAG: YajQ family cyclic di-GMP-binding protein [Bacteroidetes bacterium 47-18]|nr:MAG: YajQ family cyclic di-GMP-binding protein [Bacteroidetes bacterium 47-18]